MIETNADEPILPPDAMQNKVNIPLAIISLLMNLTSLSLILSNAIRLLLRKKFKLLILLFYFFALLTVVTSIVQYSYIIIWCFF